MGKKREQADPFGLSLLDVLSNALGGVILLMLIVAVTIKGRDDRKLNEAQEERQGSNYTVKVFEKTKKPSNDLNFDLMLVQVAIVGTEKAELDLVTDASTNGCCSLAKLATSGHNESITEYMVIRNGIYDGEWELRLKPLPSATSIQSVDFYVTHNKQVYCAEKGTPTGTGGATTLLSIRESKAGQPQIRIFGRTLCQVAPRID